ncbi:hypothetical protein BC826DRAFT_1002129 [Russula brevipes]|nr:hypothetical protein BC826DRAFT_1002129 [Russula brevipes]
MAALGGVYGTVCDEQQYQQSQISHDSRNPTIACLTHGQTIGLALSAEASFISFVAVAVIFFWIGWNIRWYRKAFPKGDWKLFRGPTDIYMFSLFAFDILQAMGGILDVRWAHNGIVTTGHYCTAQGIIQQIGELGVALITLILALHTFVAALWRVGLQARGFALGLVCLACIFIALWVGIGAGVHKNYETPTPYWCWLMYIPLYFWAEGRLSVDEERWYRFHTSASDQGVEYEQRRAALGMLLSFQLPLAYSIVVLPLSIARWSQFNHHKVTSAATFFGDSMFHLSGAINKSIGSAIFSDAGNDAHSPEPTASGPADGSGKSAVLSRVSSRRRSLDV